MKIMVDPAAPASVRVRAADSIFDHAAKAIEIEDFEAFSCEPRRQSGEPLPQDSPILRYNAAVVGK